MAETKREELRSIQDLLALVDHKVTLKEIASWSNDKREKVVKWAGKVHLRASDNIVRVPPKPKFKSKPVTYPKHMGDLYAF